MRQRKPKPFNDEDEMFVDLGFNGVCLKEPRKISESRDVFSFISLTLQKTSVINAQYSKNSHFRNNRELNYTFLA